MRKRTITTGGTRLVRTRERPTSGLDVVGPAIVRPRDPGPLLLLPMRLEYRFMETRRRPPIVDLADAIAVFDRLEKQHQGRSATVRATLLRERRQVSARMLKQDLKTAVAALPGGRELWFRWYPDDGFATKGIAPASPEEIAARERFLLALAGRSWFDPGDPGALAAWSDFASLVGPYRAVHLMRDAGAGPGYENSIGRIALLPGRVALFAVTSGVVRPLASGSAIPANTASLRSIVSYTAEAIEPGGWLRDFPIAVKHGMGVKIADAATIDLALAADHIIAIGQFGGDARGELTELIRDGIANGTFSVLDQDTATNNAPGTRSGLSDPRGDLSSYLAVATQHERGLFTTPAATAAGQLAEALALPIAELTPAMKAASTPFADAQAMLRVIGPALLDGALDGTTAVKDVDENEFVDVLALAYCARGPLPALHFGQNPYGLLPLTKVGEAVVEETNTNARAVQDFLKNYAAFARGMLPTYAEAVVPRLEPGDPQAAATLDALLKNNPVSRRVDVADGGLGTSTSIGCPYVAGSEAQHKPEAYLQELLTKPLGQLPDPDEDDRKPPLLYRLARLTLTRNLAFPIFDAVRPPGSRPVKGIFQAFETNDDLHGKLLGSEAFKLSSHELATVKQIKGIDLPVAQLLRQLNAAFSTALRHLIGVAARKDGAAQLETLLLEVIDLLQHRADALATGLAYRRLQMQRQAQNAELHAGYFGFLGKLRPQSVTGTTDGYVQAPSMEQATSAAVLRSAFLRHKAEGAFAIDLSSSRVRRALTLLDLLKKGLTLEEALGLRGERWLHDKHVSRLTLAVREAFPVENRTPPESQDAGGDPAPQPAGVRVFDGLKFIRGVLTAFPPADQSTLQQLQAALADDLDALADIAVSEAVHQRTLGQAEVAKAWLNVLSGSPVPGDPVFLRTQRQGQGSSHRVSLLFTSPAPSPQAAPREIAEPGLSSLAATLLPGFAATAVLLTLQRNDDPNRRFAMTVPLRSGLGMKAIDLVIGGISEIKVRASFHGLSQWLTDPAMAASLGAPPAEGLAAFANGAVTITIADAAAGPSLAAALAQAEKLRKLAQQGRMIEPADLNAAATPFAKLDEAKEIALIDGAVQALRGRAATLTANLTDAAARLAAVQTPFLAVVREIRRRTDIDAADPSLTTLFSAAEVRRRTLHNLLPRIAGFAEPSALRPFTIEEAVANPDAIDERLAGLTGRLAARLKALQAAAAATAATIPARLEEARAWRRLLIEALKATLDGDGLPIFPPIARRPETSPLLTPAVPPANALAEWSPVRPRLALAADVASALGGVRAHRTDAAATADDTAPNAKDPRPPEIAPRALHFGTFLARPAVMTGSAAAGFVADEWAEQRPSRNQPAALAINYDSPQSEPPHCLLLCVAPNSRSPSWSEAAAADMVFEAIQWMKVRALSSGDRLWPTAMLPRGNQVGRKGDKRRIPKRLFRLLDLGFSGVDAQFVVGTFATGESLGASAEITGEAAGFHKVKQ